LALFVRAAWFDWLPHTDGISRWMIGVTMLAIGAPSAVLAWTEPEPEP
jgi:hypothetical protein